MRKIMFKPIIMGGCGFHFAMTLISCDVQRINQIMHKLNCLISRVLLYNNFHIIFLIAIQCVYFVLMLYISWH